MAGKVFFRERVNADEGDKMPRFNVVAVAGVDLKIHAKHLRKNELEQIAAAVGAELVEMAVEDKGHKLQAAD
jgi:hypothetical protein